ncbi:CLUMA_CG009232, isoform A [Clunio marinus]|uniref:CLUMA_CG009217, isoform A n=1 Tax=Clunio marinus TaxID=568069 RepID=A0A1J1I666_9DIPT|nr:CLUMA_CG009217, isoform A [Clunio marinus]CRK95775.1 CLUMA_CG009232, isoform A [Clunio marinus]
MKHVCVPVPDEDPCDALVATAMFFYSDSVDMLIVLSAQCKNELNALSFANEEEFDAFNAEFYTTGHCIKE